MMRVLLDTNVVLDYLLDREPFSDAAAAIWEAGRKGRIDIYVSALTPVNVFYIARKLKGKQEARRIVEGIMAECQIALIDSGVLQDALALPLTDFEDAVQHVSATGEQLDALVTRDPDDYAKATLPIFSPQTLLIQLAASRDDGEPN